MGYKSTRKGKHILHFIAVSCLIAIVSIVSCVPLQDKITEMNSHHQLEQYRENLANGFFETAISNAGAVVEKSDTTHFLLTFILLTILLSLGLALSLLKKQEV